MTQAHGADVKPDLTAFRELARDHTVIPVWIDLPANGETPVSLFERLAGDGAAFLLESVEGDGRWAAHSFIGMHPWLMLRAWGEELTVTENGVDRTTRGDSIAALRALLGDHLAAHVEGLPRFAGGAVGYFSYDTVRQIERLPVVASAGDATPDAIWMLPSDMAILDNREQRVLLLHLARVATGDDADAAYGRAVENVRAMQQLMQGAPPPANAVRPGEPGPLAFRSNFTQSTFESSVAAVQEHIRAGDVFQMVLSQRFATDADVPPFRVYEALRAINPSPYLYYLRFPETTIVGSSPELLFRLEGRSLTVRPIAGTRPRGATREEDATLEASLLGDPKELAEHVMLIDLGRNDVGRVADIGSVHVTDRMVVERYSHVMHLVSSITGTLASGLDAFDAFRATFPAGTLTGAPKIRAMELIEQFEPVRRGIYGGAVGYFSFTGDADLAIAIRTMTVSGGTLSFQAGAGIVYDSVPVREYEETLHKAGALRRAIELAHARGTP